MKIIIVILLLSIKVAYFFELNSTNPINKGFIANGEQYDAKKYPYVVSIITQSENADGVWIEKSCTGSLVKELYVLTAAHCLLGYIVEDMKIYLGSRYKNIFERAEKLYIPENYVDMFKFRFKPVTCDIGVIKLQNSFPKFKKFIKIGGKPEDFQNNKAVKCTNVGFGKINETARGYEGRMMTTTVTNGKNACKGYSRPLEHWNEYLCSAAGSLTQICSGDSGGPMICNGKLYGVASYTYNYKDGESICGGPDMQTVHTFVHPHLKWVHGIIGVSKKKKKKNSRNSGNSGNLIKPHLALHTILTILSLYSVLTIILK